MLKQFSRQFKAIKIALPEVDQTCNGGGIHQLAAARVRNRFDILMNHNGSADWVIGCLSLFRLSI
jgi:hypothetical protein